MSKASKAITWKNVSVPLGKLKPWVSNPRESTDKTVDGLNESLDEFGQAHELLISPDFELYDGHQRLPVMIRKYGESHKVDCRMSSRRLTEKERRKLVLFLHAKATGQWNYDALGGWNQQELASGGFDSDMLSEWKAGVSFMDAFLHPKDREEIKDPGNDAIDRADELQEKWKVKNGDLWILGSHRVICGDSTDPATIARLMGEERAHLSFTDPPWNVNYGSNMNKDNAQGYRVRKIENDNLGSKFPEFCNAFMARLAEALMPGAPIYLKMSAQEWPVIDTAIREAGFHWSSTIIWNKDQLVLSRKDYHTKYEPLWYGWREGAARLAAVQDRKQSDVWDFERPSRSEEHPTMTPIPLIQRCIENSSKPNNIVVDIFLGSGSTLIASEGTGRICRGVEMAPKYVAVTLERWSMQTGQVPKLEGSRGKK